MGDAASDPATPDPAVAILTLLDRRAAGRTICPSEAARMVDPAGWRVAMPAVHAAARRLAAEGAVVLTQGGVATDPDAVVGAYRIRRV